MELTLNTRLLKTLAVILVALVAGVGVGRWWESGRAGEAVEYVTPEMQATIETALTEIFTPVAPEDLSAGLYTERFQGWWNLTYPLAEKAGGMDRLPKPGRFSRARVVRHNANGSRTVIVFAKTDKGKTRAYLFEMMPDDQGQWQMAWMIAAEDVVEE
ncbi:MAG: hypothetical protein D6743_18150 [Calditrichaeota bacterium]|nr:MAG: hypothetical protein D6743_18150 [Calditrichota bacterium]